MMARWNADPQGVKEVIQQIEQEIECDGDNVELELEFDLLSGA